MAKWDAAFDKIVASAVANERCPQNDKIPAAAFSALAREGRIRVRVYRKNYRVVDILVGPHAGAQTKDAPDRRRGEKPYKVVDASAPPLRATIPLANRQAPWKPGTARS